MENLVSLFVEHGLLTVFCAVLCAQLGAPIPALPFLLLAGAAAADDSGFAMHALVLAILAALFADTLWFCIGRRYGRRVLALLCRLSISPDSCVRQSELSFARRGIATLLAAKFVPGLSILAPALAGAIGMRYASFAIFDLTGIALWAGSGIAGGLLFHEQIGRLLITLSALGSMAATVIAGLLASYVAWRFWRRWRAGRRLADVARIATDELAAMMERGIDLVIVDVRTALNQLPLNDRIPGARHIDLSRIESGSVDAWPKETEIVTYCACPNDASAVKAAILLARRGNSVRVLKGGFDAWVKAGCPLQAI